MNKILLSHPFGNENVRGILTGLQRQNMLHSFHTSVACFPDSLLDKLATFPVLREFRKRTFPIEIRKKTITYPYMELGRMFARKFDISKWLEHEKGKFCINNVCRNIDSGVAKYVYKHKEDISAVYCYEDNAYSTFKQAKELGIKCYYELPTTYWKYTQKILREEAERLPLWTETMSGGLNFSLEKQQLKDEELHLSDIIIVPSEFVKDTLPEQILASKKIIINPYGSPLARNKIEKKNINRPLRVLFVGNMGQNKGLADIFSAIKLLDTHKIELITMGSLLAPLDFYKKQLSDFTYLGIQPHSKVLEIMGTCDVFCFPSLREGRALVMQEAMSQGLPLIITPNTGGADLIIDGETGFLVPIRSPQMIAEKINWFLENREQLPIMSEKAKIHASTYSWEKYGNIITGILQDNI
jgi:glycosyltransferase involved in cell wall biosynthesis